MCSHTTVPAELFAASEEEREEEKESAASLSDVITSSVLRPLAGDTEVKEEIATHLPPGQEPEGVLTSPQFQQALGVFSSALGSGQLGPLMSQFGLSSEVATAAATGGTQVNCDDNSGGV